MDGRIDAIGHLRPQPGERIIDATDCVVYPPGSTRTTICSGSLLKGEPQGLNLTLTPWLGATPYQFRAAFDEHTFRLAARIGLVELVRSGCGTVADHNYLYYPGMPFDGSAILFEEADALGLRFVLCRGGARRRADWSVPCRRRCARKRSMPTWPTANGWPPAITSPGPGRCAVSSWRPRRAVFDVAGGTAYMRALRHVALASGCTATCPKRWNTENPPAPCTHYAGHAFSSGEYEWLGPDVWFAISSSSLPRKSGCWAKPGQALRTARRQWTARQRHR
ncbi:hypothetical protein ACTMU2_06275 [Cupriavidus basilensis]